MCKLDDSIHRYARRIDVQAKRKQEFIDGMQYCDQAVSDLLHDLEFSKLTRKQLFKDAYLLIKFLRKRRKFKERLELIQAAEECRVGAIELCVKHQKQRMYRPRVLRFLDARFNQKGAKFRA